MKTLAEYLAEYIDHETVVMQPSGGKMVALNLHEIFEIVEQGIEAYESTENCSIGIIGKVCPDCGCSLKKGESALYTGHDEIEVYECPKCGYIVYG